MGYSILLVCESFVVSLLLVAVLVAATARGTTMVYRVARVAAVIFIIAIGVLYTGLSLALTWSLFTTWARNDFVRWTSLAVGFALPFIIGVVLIIRGWRRVKGDVSLLPRAAAWSLGGLVTLFLAACAIHLLTFTLFDLTIRQTLAAVRVEAYTLAASTAPPRPPEDQNAGVIYDALFQRWALSKKSWPEVFRRAEEALVGEKEGHQGDGPDAKGDGRMEAFDFGSEDLAQFLRERAGELTLLRQAAAMPCCRFERDYFRPTPTMILPQLSHFRTAARLLAVDARHCTARGNISQAVEDVNAILGIARHTREPLLLALLVSISIETTAARELENILNHPDVTEERLAHVDLGMTYSLRDAFVRSLRMEEAMGLLAFCAIGTGEIGLTQLIDEGSQPMMTGFSQTFVLVSLPPWLLEDLTVYRQSMREFQTLVAMRERPVNDQVSSLKQLEDRVKSVQSRAPLTNLLVPTYQHMFLGVARAEGHRSVVIAGLATYRYALRHNRLPGTLDELVPEYLPFVPLDPFDGHAIRMKSTAEGEVTVYSIGPDLQDDGGQPLERDQATSELKGDVIFTVRWSPEKRGASTSP